MAIQINILDNGKGMEIIISGTVRGQDIIEAHHKTHDIATISRLKYKIIDKSKVVRNYISAQEVKEIARLDRMVLNINPDIVSAIIIPNDIIGSTSHLWKSRLADNFENIKQFYSREAAEDWLKPFIESHTD